MFQRKGKYSTFYNRCVYMIVDGETKYSCGCWNCFSSVSTESAITMKVIGLNYSETIKIECKHDKSEYGNTLWGFPCRAALFRPRRNGHS